MEEKNNKSKSMLKIMSDNMDKREARYKIERAFELRQPQTVYKEYVEHIFNSMQKRVGDSFEVKNITQLEMCENSDKARTIELDGKAYYATRIDVKIYSANRKKSKSLIYIFSPFTVRYFGVRKEFSDFGKIDKILTEVLRKNMGEKFGVEIYEVALAEYRQGVAKFKNKIKNIELW